MADINTENETELVELVELLFFAYRDFVADADHLLDGLSFGRAHHRVIHFVGRVPGLTVAGLLDILKITKQSLARVLKELIDKDFVYQKEGEADRRQRLLYLTSAGENLRRKLVLLQVERFRRALAETKKSPREFHDMLLHLVDPENQKMAENWAARRDG